MKHKILAVVMAFSAVVVWSHPLRPFQTTHLNGRRAVLSKPMQPTDAVLVGTALNFNGAVALGQAAIGGTMPYSRLINGVVYSGSLTAVNANVFQVSSGWFHVYATFTGFIHNTGMGVWGYPSILE
ncbi:MAG: hypothetical protein FWE21_09750 [Defluviitaleaceae bacterium]|nr:hypothetical protein [Defluviitaleaceae bacterium]